jgi:flagellar biosynthetic protein FliQ
MDNNIMTVEFVVFIIRRALITVLTAASPVLISGLLVGLTVSVLQAVTQVNEMTLTFIPKIVAIFLSLMIFGPWIIRVILNFSVGILANLDEYARMM